jgi:hypothetical protein
VGFINAALDDVQEDKAVPEGEYDLRITDVKEGKSRKGQDMVTVMIKIEGREGEGAQPIFANFCSTPTTRRQLACRLST